jgi:hypothetical protein
MSVAAVSIASSSDRVGHLVKRAMTFFDTNREAAWRCLRDASTLLGSETDISHGDVRASYSQFRMGGLAAWQARRTLGLCRSAASRAREAHDDLYPGATHGHCARVWLRGPIALESALSPYCRYEPRSVAPHVAILGRGEHGDFGAGAPTRYRYQRLISSPSRLGSNVPAAHCNARNQTETIPHVNLTWPEHQESSHDCHPSA